MIHDELLAKLTPTQERGFPSNPITVLNTLRAVVELHKPVQGRSDISTYDYVGCDSCVEWSHDGNMNLEYPCPTIQAIEKELA
jgi:hypothetical protein